MEPLLRAEGLGKSFPGVRALEAVNLTLHPGEIHALLGENGAGKSTLMSLLAGMTCPDAGSLFLRGTPVRLPSPHAAQRAGIAMIHQEPMVFPHLSVAENVFARREPTLPIWIDRPRMRRESQALLQRLGVHCSPDAPLHSLAAAEVQVVEIARCLLQQADVLLFDEPTSSLSQVEVDRLFSIMRELRQRGAALLFTSHRLSEIFAVADRVSILRDGRKVADGSLSEFDADRLVQEMVGRPWHPPEATSRSVKAEVVLRVEDLTRPPAFCGITFELRSGEILGLGGLVGAGRSELAAAIFGLQPARRGSILLRGRPLRIRSPGDAMRHGIVMVTEDRRRWGLAPRLSVKHNLTLPHLPRFCRLGLIRRREEDQTAASQLRRFGVQPPNPDALIGHLSGGNQQKVVLAKALFADPSVIILDEPTRGIDLSAKAEIHRLIRELAARGKAVLLISSELPELLTLSHRILVMREGCISAELDPAATSQEEILRKAMPSATEAHSTRS